MPTKLSRFTCKFCGKKHVNWKTVSIQTYQERHPLHLCWSCAKVVEDKLKSVHLDRPPIRAERLLNATKIHLRKGSWHQQEKSF